MNKIIAISLIVLSIGLYLFLNLSPLYHNILEKLNLIEIIENNPDNKVITNYEGIEEEKHHNGFLLKGYDEKNYQVENGFIDFTEEYGLSSYINNKKEFTFSSVFNDGYISSIYYQKERIYDAIYYPGDMLIDTIMMGNNIVEYVYNDSELIGIMINDSYLYTHAHENIVDYYLDNNFLKSTEYAAGRVINETVAGEQIKYKYNIDSLVANSEFNTTINNQSITVSKDGNETTYYFGYAYHGNRYVNKIVNENNTFELFYLNDKVISVKRDELTIVDYILDKELNYIGYIADEVIYFYLYDLDGNVLATIDYNGNLIEQYQYTSFGKIYSSNPESINNIVLTGYFYDKGTGIFCGKNGLINPFDYLTINIDGQISPITATFANEIKKNAFQLDYVLAMNVFKDYVQNDVIANLSNNGIIVAPNVDCIDNNSRYFNNIDIYTLDAVTSEMSLGNLINGNQAYTIVYNDLAGQEELKYATAMLEEMVTKKAAFYTGKYEDASVIKKGTLEFSGQFIFMDYLISYSCNGDGIIHYTFSENDINNYRTYFNIYNYDEDTYVNYTEKTFDVKIDFNNSTTIIPGLNQEIYDVVKNYIEEVEIIGGQILQNELRYFDETYYDAYLNSLEGDTLDLSIYADVSEDDMLVLGSNGDLVVKALPFYNNPKFIRNTLITGTMITVLGVISFAVPGGQWCIPILGAVVKGAATAYITSFLTSATVYTLNNINEDDFFANLPEFLNQAVIDISRDVLIGASIGLITSSIKLVSTLKHTKYFKYSDKNLKIREVTAQEVLDEFKMTYMWDIPNAQAEYEKYKKLAKIPYTVVSGNEGGFINRLLKMYDDHRILFNYISKTGMSHGKIEWEELR